VIPISDCNSLNETENNEKKDGGRKRKVQKKMAAGLVFEEDTTNEINI
jgi:hypothetical protein